METELKSNNKDNAVESNMIQNLKVDTSKSKKWNFTPQRSRDKRIYQTHSRLEKVDRKDWQDATTTNARTELNFENDTFMHKALMLNKSFD